MAKRGIVARVKTAEERGHPASAWAFEARTRLGLSDRQVVEMLGRYDPATIRQAEANSDRLSRPLWRALVPLYQGLARERGVALPPPPVYREPEGRAVREPGAEYGTDLAALIASNERLASATAAFTEAVDSQTQKLDRVWDRLGDLIERLDRQQPLTKDDAMAMSEGLADGIGAALSGSIADLAAALRQPAPAKPGGRG